MADTLVVGGYTGSIYKSKVSGFGKLLGSPAHNIEVISCFFSQDGQSYYTFSADGLGKKWALKNNSEIETFFDAPIELKGRYPGR